MFEGSLREKVLIVRKFSYIDEEDDTVNCLMNLFVIEFIVNFIVFNLIGLRKNFEILEYLGYRC